MTIRQLLNKYKGDTYIVLKVNDYENGRMKKDKFKKVFKDLLEETSFEFDFEQTNGNFIIDIMKKCN